MPLLEVKNLEVGFETTDGVVLAVRGIDFTLEPGESLAIVGESGSGKTQSMMALMGLLAENGKAAGQALYKGEDLMALDEAGLARHRGSNITMIFQDPMTALNPFLRIERQMTEVVIHHQGLSKKQARAQAIEMLRAVRMPDPEQRIRDYPHQFSGGMRQRILIAMALLCEPDVLIADEPTTALDVTVQAQIARLVAEVRKRSQMATVLITHDLGVVAGVCDKVMVLYAGEVVEYGTVEQIYYQPKHPYTRGLLKSVPRLDLGADHQLHAIPGNPPNLFEVPEGCVFRPRCSEAFEDCMSKPKLRDVGDGQQKRCHLEGSA